MDGKAEFRINGNGKISEEEFLGNERKPVIEPASPEEIVMAEERMKDYEKDPSSFVPLSKIK